MRLVCGILLLILAMSGGGVANADSERVYQNPWQPLETIGLNNCNGEQYSFTGETLSRATVRNDASGGQHVSTLLRIRGTGVGLSSGSKYVTNEGGHVTERDVAAGPVNFTATFVGVLNSLDPQVANETYRLTQHFTINANGEMTSSIDEFVILCR